MERIKNIEESIIGEGEVLVELIEKERGSGIILPEDGMSKSQSSNYGIVLAVGASVTDIEAGDIILQTRVDKVPGYTYKGKNVALFSRYNIAVAVKPVNFDNTAELSA